MWGAIIVMYHADSKNATNEQMAMCGDAHGTEIMRLAWESHFPFADLMQFMKCFVDRESLHRMSTNTGMDYKKVSVDWASFCRELAVE